MPRLIDADALKELIANHVYPVTDAFNSRDYGMFWTGGIEKAIDDAPTVKAEPVKHGQWIEGNNFYWYSNSCSCCGYTRTTDIKSNGWNQWKYCPMCGAKMDGERREDDE